MTAVWILELVLKSFVLLVECLLLAVFSPFLMLYVWISGILFRARFVKNACACGMDKPTARMLAQNLKWRKVFEY